MIHILKYLHVGIDNKYTYEEQMRNRMNIHLYSQILKFMAVQTALIHHIYKLNI